MPDFYRFRPIKSLLGEYQELESQTIFFASPEQLNDPMEGFRDIYWHGDEIAWNNLIRHYLICLTHAFTLLSLHGEAQPIGFENLPISTDGKDFPSDEFRQSFAAIYTHFTARKEVGDYLRALIHSDRKVRRAELQFHLQNIHLIALDSIRAIYDVSGLVPRNSSEPIDIEEGLRRLNASNFTGLLGTVGPPGKNYQFTNALFDAQVNAMAHVHLLQKHRQTIDHAAKNKNLVFVDFPGEYVRAIECLIFPLWYTACFMSECSNSAVWGHYGDSHRGVCLVFDSVERNGKACLPVTGIHGASSDGLLASEACIPFERVDYTEGLAEIDFFRSIGRLPVPVLNAMWYRDLEGRASVCAQDSFTDQRAWRERYWKSFHRDIVRKTRDWEYGKEYRLIVNDGSSSIYLDPANRKMKYDFGCLKGIIFGINTSVDDKLEIVRIVERKCLEAHRHDFKFYQASYSPTERRVLRHEMTLFKLN